MTKLDPSRTPCDDDFAAAVRHAALAGAFRIVGRRPETDPTSKLTLSQHADDHSGKARWFMSCLAEVKPRGDVGPTPEDA